MCSPELFGQYGLGVFVCRVQDDVRSLVNCERREADTEMLQQFTPISGGARCERIVRLCTGQHWRRSPVIWNFFTVLLLSLLTLILIGIVSPWK